MKSVIEWLEWFFGQQNAIFYYAPPLWVHYTFAPLVLMGYPLACLLAKKIRAKANRPKKFSAIFEWKWYFGQLMPVLFHYFNFESPKGTSFGFAALIIYAINFYFIFAVLYTAIRDVRAEQEDAAAETPDSQA